MSLSNEGVPFTMPVAPANSYGGGNGGWGGDWGAWIILFLIFGMFGWGGFGGGFGGAGGALTRADLCQDMNFSQLENGVRGIQQGICDSTYALNNSINGIGMNMMQGFHGVDNAICNLGFTTQQGFNATQVAMMQGNNALQSQISQCCCETQRQIERGFCDTNYNQATNTTAIIQNAHNDTDRVIAKLDAMEMSRKDEKIAELQSLVNSLNLAQSQANQNNYLVSTLRPCPTPAYITCNPWASQTPYGGCCGAA